MGIIAGGIVDPMQINKFIDYVTIASEGNAVDFGDLTVGNEWWSNASNNSCRFYVLVLW